MGWSRRSVQGCCCTIAMHRIGEKILHEFLWMILFIVAVICFVCYISQERLIDRKNKRGHIYHRICYLKFKKPLRKGKKKVAEQAVDTEPVQSDDEAEIDELQFLLYFKTCLVDRDLDILKIKLKQSIQMREQLMEKKGTEFHKTFPFFFIQPSLVRLNIDIWRGKFQLIWFIFPVPIWFWDSQNFTRSKCTVRTLATNKT